MQRIHYFHIFILLLNIYSSAEAAKILFFHLIGSYSHRAATYPLANALSARGHQVFFLSPFHNQGPIFNPNVTEIIPEEFKRAMTQWIEDDFDITRGQGSKHSYFSYLMYSFPASNKLCRTVLESSELHEFHQTTSSLDLIIIDNCFSECGAIIAQKHGAKVIIYNTVSHFPHEHDLWGMLPESSAIPETGTGAPIAPMTFLERVRNTLISIRNRWQHLNYMANLDQLANEHLNSSANLNMHEIMQNVSLVLYPEDLVTDFPRQHAPLVVPIGGIHCNYIAKPLPTEIIGFIEENPNSIGVVYISFGSLALTSRLPERFIQILLKSVRRLPHIQFIWKWDSPIPKDKPKNLYLGNWLPQQDILAHPKVLALVTQSGRPSTMEAVCNAVPMVSFPVFGDQDNIANRMIQMGAAVKLNFATVSSYEFVQALTSVAYSIRMKERLIELRGLVLDRPMSGIDSAIWWVEYVHRNKDTNHLRPAGFGQYWFQRRLLDVWLFLFVILMISMSVAIKLVIYAAMSFVHVFENHKNFSKNVVSSGKKYK